MKYFFNLILLFFLIIAGLITVIMAFATGGVVILLPIGGIAFAIVSVIRSLKQNNKASEVISELKEKARNGDVDSQWELGCVYYEGLKEKEFNINKNMDKALKYFEKASLQGHNEAQAQAGVIYYERENYSKSVKWSKKSAVQGNVIGQNNIGYLYEKGLGVRKDLDKAARWYSKCIKNSNDSHIKSEAKEGLARIKKSS